ncbi:MAG: right-handed parallel beta-helix repeat-containing protein [Lentisphaerae bacterium]|nr:right-handed parallel beta-helix repeat-containing protein [Lentisphaerota bacterium]
MSNLPNHIVFPAPPGATISRIYSVTVNGAPVAVEHFEDIHMARFALRGACQVEILVKPSIGHRNLKYISRFDVRPLSYQIAATAELNVLRFTLDRPRQLVIDVNAYERLFLFADPYDAAEPVPGQEGVVSLADFASDATGATLQTARIAAAIAAVPKGGVLFVPPGLYQTGTVTLKSDMTLYLAGGAVLKGSSNPSDYPADTTSWHWSNQWFVGAMKAENVRIAGYGVLDANGSIVRGQQCGPHLLVFTDCRHVTVENITVRDPAAWCVHPINSDHVLIRHVKSVCNRDVLNTDGFDITSCRDTVIENSFQYCSDDGAVIKTSGGIAAENITVRGSVFLTKKSALKVGTETEGDVNHVTFIDNDVIECDRGMTLSEEDGHVIRHTQYINNRFEMPLLDARRRLIDFYTWNRKGGGRIENTLIKDCVALQKWPRPSTLFACSGPIDGVRFENFQIAGKVCRSLPDADTLVEVLPCNDARRATVYNVTFEPAARPGPVNLALG